MESDSPGAPGVGAFPLVLLAGGKSSRLGSPKGLVDVAGAPWLERQLARFAAAGGTRALVVTGFDTQAYAAALRWFTRAAAPLAAVDVAGVSVTVVENPMPERGPFSSLACALAHDAARTAPGVWVLPIDCPLASPTTLRALAEALTPHVEAVIPTYESAGGHPVLLASTFVAHLVTVPAGADDARLDRQLHARPASAIARVAVDDTCVRQNLNTASDWATAALERVAAITLVDRARPGNRPA